MCGTVRQGMRGAVALPGSKATSRAKGSYRNLGMMHGHEKSDLVIVVMKPANKAKEAPLRGERGGVGGAKGQGQGKYAPAKHALDS